MSKKKEYFKSFVTPDPILCDHFTLGSLVYFKNGSFVAKKSDQSAFGMTVGCGIMHSKEANDLFQIIGINRPYPTSGTQNEFAVPINNMKVRSINTGTIYYCSTINVVNCCGSIVEIETRNTEVIYKGVSTTLKTILKKSKFGNYKLV